MSAFEIALDWLDAASRHAVADRGVSDATLSKLNISLEKRSVTEFVEKNGEVLPAIQIPAYYLAEWVADNWWSILWEPRKSEDDSDDAGFLSRHSFLAAQHGFALPKIEIVPIGKAIEVRAAKRDVPIADVRFRNWGLASCERSEVESTLRGFVESVVGRLDAQRISESWLQDTWSLITETDEEQAAFCRLVGALGLSPYDVDENVANLIERLSPLLGDRVLLDLCLTSSADQFPAVAQIAEKALEITRGVQASTLKPIETTALPQENLGLPAYRRGVQAAELLRKRLKISDLDVSGASRIFDLLEIDTKSQAIVSSSSSQVLDEAAVTGAVVRNDSEMRVGLLQQKLSKRRFAGARAIFSAWSSDGLTETRLLTSAVTRDQQANRAFAAEITAPKNFLRSKAKNSRLSPHAIQDLAAELQIGADVVAKQAHNNGIRIERLQA